MGIAFAEHAPLPMAIVQVAERILVQVNPAFCRLVGKSREELIGKSFAEMLPEKEHCMRLLDRVLRTKIPVSHNEMNDLKTHPTFWSYTMWPVTVNERAIGVMLLVTETDELHQNILEMNEALVLGVVRQHQRAEMREKVNAQLLNETRGDARINLERFLRFMEHMPGGAFIKDLGGEYVYANEQMNLFREGEPTEWVGRSDKELFPKEIAESRGTADQIVIQSGQPHRSTERAPGNDGIHEVLMHKFPLFNVQGSVEAVAGFVVDITDLKRAQARNEAALKQEVVLRREINHRVKNNLQVITSLLYLQCSKSEDPVVRAVLLESQARIRSLSLIYERLSGRGTITRIPFVGYMEQLATEVFAAFKVDQEAIKLNITSEEVFFDLDTAVPCGLILTELISNALKYAFPAGETGEVKIDLHSMEGGLLCLTVGDNGIGFPDGFDLEKSNSLGMGLVSDLTRQLKGKVQLHNESGATARIIFPARDWSATG